MGEHRSAPLTHTYECLVCGTRTTAEHQPGACPKCGGQMQNIDNTRE